jgi:hypothetical protein
MAFRNWIFLTSFSHSVSFRRASLLFGSFLQTVLKSRRASAEFRIAVLAVARRQYAFPHQYAIPVHVCKAVLTLMKLGSSSIALEASAIAYP